jgi:microcystin degradation protein MlrC
MSADPLNPGAGRLRADRIILVDTPGVVTNDFTKLPFRKIKLPKWPFPAD